MGGIVRCIRNEYNLDKVENEINRTDSEVDFDRMLVNIKQKNNIYIDIDDDTKNEENIEDHYLNNSLLEKGFAKKSQSMYIPAKKIKDMI
jgi:hypothetical protein